MNQLKMVQLKMAVYCGCCGKPVAIVDDSGDLNVLHGTLKECPRCGGQCIQNDQVILRDTAMDKITVVKVMPRPVEEYPDIPQAPQPGGFIRKVVETIISPTSYNTPIYSHVRKPVETVSQGAHSDKPERKPDAKKKSKSSGFFKRKN